MNKLFIFGDSILKGVTFSDERRRLVIASSGGYGEIEQMGYDVKNKSRLGATITKGLGIMDETLEECGEGDIVLIEYGGNDCDYEWQMISEDPDGDFLPHTPEAQFTKEYAFAIEKVRERGAIPILSTLVPVDAERYMKWITRDKSYENILKWLGDTSMLYRWQERYNRLVEAIARCFRCQILDVRDKFLLSHDYKSLISADGIHPTEEGHAIIRSALSSILRERAATV